MSVKIMSKVWEESRQTGTALLMLLAIADHANDDGVCWPSVARLAQRARVQERQAKNLISQLEAAGELSVQRGQGRTNTSIYVVKIATDDYTPGDVERATHRAEQVFGILEKVQSSAEKGAIQREKVQSSAPEKVQSSAEKGAIQREKVQSSAPEKVQSSAEKGAIQREKVQSSALKGAIAIAPEPLEPSLEPSREPPVVGTAPQPPQPTDEWRKVQRHYENNIGLLTPLLLAKVKEATQSHGADVVIRAIEQATVYEKRNWAYVEAILRRWADEGYGAGTGAAGSKNRGHRQNGHHAPQPATNWDDYARPVPNAERDALIDAMEITF
jgi:DnaD/phage-associated family protein